jgi:hypothetical protein
MSWGIVAAAGATVVGGLISSDAQRSAGNKAADAQSASAEAGIAESRRQFDAIQQLLAPFVQGGTGALTAQQNLIGLNGNAAQQSAINALQESAQFKALQSQGTNAILQNASATGGLRGGNTQAALAQFSPALLAQTINDQYSRLGGLTSLGQSSAAMTGNAGLQTGSQISQLLQQQGSAQAGAYLSAGKSQSGLGSLVGNLGGMAASYFSDRRLKTNIVPIGLTERGNRKYRWDWIDGSGSAEGVIADEVAHIPGAVHRHPSGFDVVNYEVV